MTFKSPVGQSVSPSTRVVVHVAAEGSMHNRVLGLRCMSLACRACVAHVRPLCGALCFRRVCPTCPRSPREVFSCGALSEFSSMLSWRNRRAGKHTFIERVVSATRSRYWMHNFVPSLAFQRPLYISLESNSGHFDGRDVSCHWTTYTVNKKAR